MDNLAWVWVHERGLTKKISRNQVGLRAKSEQVRGTFSPEFRAYLVTLDEEWFPYITDYRDALAHRIPLYVPQRVRTEDLDQYNDLTRRMNEAIESGQWEEHGVLFLRTKFACCVSAV